MGMFDEIGKIEDTAGSGSYKMPVGEHPATVSDLKLDHDNGYVDFKLNFIGAGVHGYNRWFMKGNDPEKVKKAHARYCVQLRNAGLDAFDGPSMGRAIEQLEGRSVIVNVTNDKQDSKYQRYWIEGPYVAKRAAPEPGNDASSGNDDLPFAILLAPLAAALVGFVA